MFNHEKERGNPYCPIMREVCIDGWTKAMGEDKDGRRNKCVAWRPLPLMDKPSQEVKTVFACAQYEWPPFLNFELSALMSQTRASVDKTATEVQKQHMTFLSVLPSEIHQRLLTANPQLGSKNLPVPGPNGPP